jgi:hypothetical protein
MPRKPIDYKNTIIYKIVCNDTSITDCYVGHTTDFTNRKNKHKSDAMDIFFINVKLYSFIREHGGWDNWSMVPIEEYPCINSFEATARERHHYDLLKANLNTNRMNVTKADKLKDKELKCEQKRIAVEQYKAEINNR